jgi:hypothetical protein
MPIGPIRVKQSTNTTGTGTLTLNAASAGFRGFTTGFGSGTYAVRYLLQREGIFEVGYGTYSSSAGTLTRDTVVASSNSNALVSLAAGTTDVFFDYLPGDRQARLITASATLDLSDLGNIIRCFASSNITVTLPPIASVPGGNNRLSASIAIRNRSDNGSIVWIDPNGSEPLEGETTSFPLFAGEGVELFSADTGWFLANRPTGWRQVARATASGSASVDFTLPHYRSAQRSMYDLVVRNCRVATDGAFLLLRMAAGGVFASGAADYGYGFGVPSGPSSWAGGGVTGSGIALSSDSDSTSTAAAMSGRVLVLPGAGGVRNPQAIGTFYTQGNGGSYAGPQPQIIGGIRNAATDIDGLRLVATTGNIALGDVTLFACFD